MRYLHGQVGHRKIRTAPTEETGELPWKVSPKNRPELPKNTPSKLARALLLSEPQTLPLPVQEPAPTMLPPNPTNPEPHVSAKGILEKLHVAL